VPELGLGPGEVAWLGVMAGDGLDDGVRLGVTVGYGLGEGDGVWLGVTVGYGLGEGDGLGGGAWLGVTVRGGLGQAVGSALAAGPAAGLVRADGDGDGDAQLAAAVCPGFRPPRPGAVTPAAPEGSFAP